MEGTASTNIEGPSYLEFVGVGTSDAHKPTYRQLRDEGLSQTAIETLMLSRDALVTMPATEIADWIKLSVAHYPLAEADVWPAGKPEHWLTDADLLDAFTSGLTS